MKKLVLVVAIATALVLAAFQYYINFNKYDGKINTISAFQKKLAYSEQITKIPVPVSISIYKNGKTYKFDKSDPNFNTIYALSKLRFHDNIQRSKYSLGQEGFKRAKKAETLIEFKYSNKVRILVNAGTRKEKEYYADGALFPLTGGGNDMVFLFDKGITSTIGTLSMEYVSALEQLISGYFDTTYIMPKTELLTNKQETSSEHMLASDLKKLFIIQSKNLDLNLDGIREKVYFVGTPPKELNKISNGGDVLFYNPSYFVYTNPVTKQLEKIEIECQSYAKGIDLWNTMLNVGYADLDGDRVPEIIYLYSFPYPEPVAWNPYVLKYNPKTGGFSELSIDGQNYRIRTWDIVDIDKDGISELRVELQIEYATKPYTRFLKLRDDKFIEIRDDQGVN